jgi:uncharacterized RDD family membrane protein YckC
MTRPINPRNLVGAVQGNLFTPNVIPISAGAPWPAKPTLPPPTSRPSQRAKASASASASSSGIRPPARRATRTVEGQGELEFLPVQPAQPRKLASKVDPLIDGDSTAAAPMHRAVAGALDWSIVLIGYGLFLATFYLCGGRFDLDRNNLMIFGAALLLVGCTYGLVWTIAGTESAGMRWTHLRLITFDGSAPNASRRFLRFAGSCLSFATVVGVVWALFDEESLGWQDIISGTFPTTYERETPVFQRR